MESASPACPVSPVSHDPRDAVYIARQPILLPSGRVYGYELLYRAAASELAHAPAAEAHDDVAGARVLTDSILTIGLETLTSGLPAFINLTPRLLMNGAATLLPAHAAVFEITPDACCVADLTDACRWLHQQGYTLALDGAVDLPACDRLLPFMRFAKLPVSSMTPDTRRATAEALLHRGIRLVATGVDSLDVAEDARAAGYGLAQGFYFCAPSTHSATPVPARRTAYLQLLAALNNPHLTMGELEDLIKHDISLCLRVLRCVNSAAFGVRGEIQSIRQALMMLGLEQIRKWASVWSLAGIHGSGTPETITVALVRARCCERLGQIVGGSDTGSEYFLLGLCSLLDQMMQRPMAAIVSMLPLSQNVRGALLGQPNAAHAVLTCAIAYERGRFDEAAAAAGEAHITAAELVAAYFDALQWARALTHDSATA